MTQGSERRVIILASLSPFGRGGKRECFVDPLDPDRCIKVPRPGYEPEALFRAAPWYQRWRKKVDDFDKNFRDWEVLSKLEPQSDIWRHLPRCHGWVQTDRGRGLAIEMIRDHDGQISRSFKDYLWTEGFNDAARLAVEDYVTHARRYPLATRTLVLYNFAAQVRVDGTVRLVFIDGLGTTEFVPLSLWSRSVARWKCERKIRHMWKQIKELMAQRERGENPGRWGFLLSRK
ncbi:MAG: hypothetical protein DWH91_14690 [Planctomycetota bacterium]|nr:MAG: hypothetical protein DWH91_14690 [Planctomycetota bacterium]